ncbi:UNVERIFIED_CONTAM: hypothetical protein PYX00_010452 [Menopon gallinae]|uniref:Proton channel OtopLc n=1 Tax=Menopon gallinae TaxID=328185 RepID=A0AAW2HFU3_9NEOP
MQRCPYLYEMKERLLQDRAAEQPLIIPTQQERELSRELMDSHRDIRDAPVGTIVKLNPDGYGSHTSLNRHPLDHCLANSEFDCHHTCPHEGFFPKNAKTSLFVIMSFIYAKLLIVICIAYVISEVVTHNIPLYYYEGFFTYLYGMSIVFLLYIFCFLLQESACCSGGSAPKEKKPKPVKQKKPKKEKPPKKEKEPKEKKEKEKKDKKDKGKDGKDEKGKEESKAPPAPAPPQPQGQGGEKGVLSGALKNLKKPEGKDVNLNEGDNAPPPPQPPEKVPERDVDVESGYPSRLRKRKTSQNDSSHGSFFLRVGAIAFGLGTMIYNGLEFGAFFEVPFSSPCYQILRGVNPLLQLIFTFMQMYFIFMNSRLNIHRFKLIARFGLMHIIATNLCVWIRTLVLESLKEITLYHQRNVQAGFDTPEKGILRESIRQHTLRNAGSVLGTHLVRPDIGPTTTVATTLGSLAALGSRTQRFTQAAVNETARFLPGFLFPTLSAVQNGTTLSSTTSTLMSSTTTTPTPVTTFGAPQNKTVPPFIKMLHDTFHRAVTTTVSTTAETPRPKLGAAIEEWIKNQTEIIKPENKTAQGTFFNLLPSPQMLTGEAPDNMTFCGRVNVMGTIVQDSAPYLFPLIIEYSLIGAAVIYIMWRHIGRQPRYVEEDLEHRLEVMLSHRAVALARAQHGRVDCVGASKGLFFGLLLLVGSLICLILFFVLIQHQHLGLLAIYLADASHCALMILSIFAIIIGFIRVRSLKFKSDEQSDLNDILLRVSAFGLFIYAVFSVIAGALNAFTHEPNFLVMVTGALAILQVVLQLLFIADVSRRRVHLPEHDRSKPGRQIVTFLLICNVTMYIIYTFEAQKVVANPVQLDFYGFLAWSLIQRITLPLCMFHRFHSAVTLAEVWKTSYKTRLE